MLAVANNYGPPYGSAEADVAGLDRIDKHAVEAGINIWSRSSEH